MGLALLLIFNIAYASDKGAIIGGIAGGVICNKASKGDPVATLFCTALGAAAGHELIDKPNERRDQERHERHEPDRHRPLPPSPPPPPIYDDGWNRCDDVYSYSRGHCSQWQEEPYRESPYCYGPSCRRGCQKNYWHSGDRICFREGRITYFPPSDNPCRKMVCNDTSDSCRCVDWRRRW
ncbi:hypothetical protein PN36_12715 [Candidatus Thiomargarita nelsonii]|uniref:Glycine zipper 2TM domain-containing protein n=1 Tax=Candidatus Thiomargarita nelsonii TaxID=1003181 RepID=A0A4E0QTX1_9GAMM|nr:hypothetical protein PN36_12715 [Candidatus Thiomargarita nelsonii]